VDRAIGVPAFWLRGELLVGFRAGDTDVRIRALLAARDPEPPPDDEVETRMFGRLSAETSDFRSSRSPSGWSTVSTPAPCGVALRARAVGEPHSRTKMLLIMARSSGERPHL
jgi:hypothetical protein